MRRIAKTKRGFTLIELSLSLVFIAVLSLTVAYIINDTVASYRKGVTIKQVNTIGMSIVNDIRSSVRNGSTTDSFYKMCEKYKGSNLEGKCQSENGRGFVTIEFRGTLEGEDERAIPLSGAFCTGDYSYIWNSGYFFNGKASPDSAATFTYRDNTIKNFRLLKVKDTTRSICVGYSSDPTNQFSSDDNTILEKEPPIDLLTNSDTGGSEGDEGLALYELQVANPAESRSSNNKFYAISFILGTVRGGINILSTGGACAAPEDDEEDFDYCAINKFNFAVQTAGGTK